MSSTFPSFVNNDRWFSLPYNHRLFDSLLDLVYRDLNLFGKTRKGPFVNRMWKRWASVNSIFDPVYALFQPVTRFMPLTAQDFLDVGGWLMALPGLGGLAWYGWQRRRRSLGLETG